MLDKIYKPDPQGQDYEEQKIEHFNESSKHFGLQSEIILCLSL